MISVVGEKNKRLHKRHEIECPVTLFGQGGEVLAKTTSVNISNGGALITVPLSTVHHVGSRVNISLTVSCSDDLVEGYATSAHVIRHEAMEDNSIVGMGLQFETELQMAAL